MGAVGLIIAILVGAGYWYWRIQMARSAADNVIDLAARARGAFSRGRFRAQARASVLAGVEDAGTAAATLLYGVASLKGPVLQKHAAAFDAKLADVCRMAHKDREEALAFAEWAYGQVHDVNEIIRRFSPLWLARLDKTERQALIDMAIDLAELDGPPNDQQDHSIRRLANALFPE